MRFSLPQMVFCTSIMACKVDLHGAMPLSSPERMLKVPTLSFINQSTLVWASKPSPHYLARPSKELRVLPSRCLVDSANNVTPLCDIDISRAFRQSILFLQAINYQPLHVQRIQLGFFVFARFIQIAKRSQVDTNVNPPVQTLTHHAVLSHDGVLVHIPKHFSFISPRSLDHHSWVQPRDWKFIFDPPSIDGNTSTHYLPEALVQS